jgi:hypothetical protein
MRPLPAPFAFNDFVSEECHPVGSLLYGPVYLMGCWPVAWLCFRRSTLCQKRRIVLVSPGVILVEWAAILAICPQRSPRHSSVP